MSRKEKEFEPPGFGWEVRLKSKFRWKKGLQFGSHLITIPYERDEEGREHYKEPVHGPWTWYNWRLKRVEGPEEDWTPVVKLSVGSEGVRSVGVELQEGEVQSVFLPNKQLPPET